MKKSGKGKYSAQVARRYFRRNKTSTSLLSNKNIERLRCETLVSVRAIDGNQVFVNQNTNSIWNCSEIVNSYTWILCSADFLKYKIYGIEVRATPVADTTTLCDGLDNVPMAIAFYPTSTNVSVPNNEVMNNDNAFYIEPHVTTPQVKTWYFPDGYFEASSSGFGVWTATASATSQIGQLSIGNYIPFVNFAVDKTCYMLRITFLVVMGYRRV